MVSMEIGWFGKKRPYRNRYIMCIEEVISKEKDTDYYPNIEELAEQFKEEELLCSGLLYPSDV